MEAVDLQFAIEGLIRAARQISEDVGAEVERALQAGLEIQLSYDAAYSLLARVMTEMRNGAVKRGDDKTLKALSGNIDELVKGILSESGKSNAAGNSQSNRNDRLILLARDGIKTKSVQPAPIFHGRTVNMNSGFVKTTDIKLWDQNVRLDIHLRQFKKKFGQDPSSDELLDIMLSKLRLPGEDEADAFKIMDLARSIAINGVRIPPILDIDGTLLDGNRRVTACNLILNSKDFSNEQKKRVEYLFVWQLTEHSTEPDREAVVVALNFEPDYKQPWPEYVKAQKVYEEWRTWLSLLSRKPSAVEERSMKRELSEKFALGPDASQVNRYIKMVDGANEFEEYHINERSRDRHEVMHTTKRYFQYFEELAKGAKPGGVAWSLEQDESFKNLAYELLYTDKFKNWTQIRDLKYIFDNEEARTALLKARDEDDLVTAQDHVESAIIIAKGEKAERRTLGANTRIEGFVKWLEALPVKAFRDDIKKESLRRLLDALKLVERYAVSILGD
jgi:hypothetical protein